MKMLAEENQPVYYIQETTAASNFNDSYSSATESSLTDAMRNAILLVDLVPQMNDYATINKADRARMKKVYPKPSIAKSPPITEDVDII